MFQKNGTSDIRICYYLFYIPRKVSKLITQKIRTPLVPRYLEILTKEVKIALQVQHRILLESRKTLNFLDFKEFLAPVIGPVTDPGIRGAKQVSFDYYGRSYKVMSSIILYKQALIRSFDKIYASAPNVRIEPLSIIESSRHLCEFYQLDLEMKGKSIHDVMSKTEFFLVTLFKKVKRACIHLFEEIEREFLVPQIPFPVFTYSELFDRAQSMDFQIKYGEEIPWVVEEKLSKTMVEPFWIIDYPVGSRGFYYKENPERPGTLLSMDLIYPEGFGEASSGGERETDVRKIKQLLHNTEEDISNYKWYLDMLSVDGQPSSGLGIGIERLTRYMLGYDEIDKCTAFPKKPGMYSI